jgi:NIMA (never in mitosis gene a)-related kinase
MEHADAGDLHQQIVKQRDTHKTYFHESQVRNWFVQLTFALQYLHKNRILHRDIKSQNVFMTSIKLLKLGDFGISKTLKYSWDYLAQFCNSI